MQGGDLRVLFVIDGMWVGGAERSLAEMLPYFVDAGVMPTVVCFRRYPEEGVEEMVLNQGIALHFIEEAQVWRRIHALRDFIRAQRPRLIHTSLFNANVAGALAAWKLNMPVLNSLVTMSYEPARYRDPRINPTKLRIVQTFDGWLSRNFVTHFHAVSNAMQQAATTTLGIPAERITVVYRGRDPGRLGVPSPNRRREARRMLGLDEDDLVIVNVGRQEYQKGQRYLLEAIAQLVPAHKHLVLLIAGRTGAASDELLRFRVQLGLQDRVHMLGHRADIPELLAASDIFAFPSLFEGLPGAVIEAMALGLPIVASDIGPVREVVSPGENALLAPAGDSFALGAALETLLVDPARASTFGARSRQLFLERFTLQESATRMVELFRKVARPA